MIHIFRKNQRAWMLVIAVLTIVSFIFLYNTSQLDNLSSMKNPSIYGESLSPGALDRQVKNYRLTMMLGQLDLLAKLGGTGEDRESSLSDFVWNLLILRHQARELGVEPTDQQVAARIKEIPVFQTSGQFDPIKYQAFVRDNLAPLGFTERQLEEVLRDSLRLEKISAIVEAPVAVGEAEIRDSARVLQPVTASFVRFDAAAAAAGIQVPETEIVAAYERNRAALSTPELRSVKFVAFELPGDSKLEGKEKIEALQKLANAASKFAESLGGQAGALQKTASTAGLTVQSTPAFDRSGALQGDNADNKVAPAAKVIAPAAFLLPEPGKASDVIGSDDGFYVAELAELTPARPLTLAEATPMITARLREELAARALREKAATQIAALREAVAGGKSFADAASQAGLKVESLANVQPMAESTTPDQRRIIAATLSLKDGEISGFENATGGGFTVYLQSRGPIDDKEFAKKRPEIVQGLLENKRNLLFAEWLRTCRDEAKIFVPGVARR